MRREKVRSRLMRFRNRFMSSSRIMIVPLFLLILLTFFSTISGHSDIFSLTTGNNSAFTEQQLPLIVDGTILNTIFNKTQDSVVQITRTVPQTGVVSIDPSQENRTALGSGFHLLEWLTILI